MPVVLYGVGTDYAVFLLYRYRERLRAGDDHRTAMANAIGRVGSAVVASALAVAVSFSAMLISGLAHVPHSRPVISGRRTADAAHLADPAAGSAGVPCREASPQAEMDASQNIPVLAWFSNRVTTRPGAVAVFA